MDDVRGRYCPDCGAALTFGAEGERPRCAACGFVRYRNPIVGVAVVVRDEEGRVLLGRRAKGEYAGQWCIPCGYVEWDEEVRAAAEREFHEETGLVVHVGDVVAVHSNFHNPKQHTVGIWFRGDVREGELAPLDGELDALAYFEPGEPPALAFPTDALVLRQLADIPAVRDPDASDG
jgi:ADP-ribose pyrophosphatase YjhB (NUDIX family)